MSRDTCKIAQNLAKSRQCVEIVKNPAESCQLLSMYAGLPYLSESCRITPTSCRSRPGRVGSCQISPSLNRSRRVLSKLAMAYLISPRQSEYSEIWPMLGRTFRISPMSNLARSRHIAAKPSRQILPIVTPDWEVIGYLAKSRHVAPNPGE